MNLPNQNPPAPAGGTDGSALRRQARQIALEWVDMVERNVLTPEHALADLDASPAIRRVLESFALHPKTPPGTAREIERVLLLRALAVAELRALFAAARLPRAA